MKTARKLHCILSLVILAIILPICILESNNFQIFALPSEVNAKGNVSKLDMFIQTQTVLRSFEFPLMHLSLVARLILVRLSMLQ
jgi:hypothetical protein